jgi:mRNA-degrading endonuclease toxin of MazEF toxin-antitoxin module
MSELRIGLIGAGRIGKLHGEIWVIALDPAVGAEMKKSRPVVIIHDDTLGRLSLKVIAPITDWKEQYAAFFVDGKKPQKGSVWVIDKQ